MRSSLASIIWRASLSLAASTQLLVMLLVGPVEAESSKGTFNYSSVRACVSAGKFTAEICALAEANAAAEFEEKAPRFPTRVICEQAFGPSSCSIGFRGAEGWTGRKEGVYFAPRQEGFRLTAKSEHDVSVVPLAAPRLVVSSRSALRRDAAINPRASRYLSNATAMRPAAAGRVGSQGYGVGVATPQGSVGAIPPPPPVDPNFNCASYLEPDAKGDPNTGCAPAPARGRGAR